jgi:3-oxoacyl-[acyl-carrier protein] reductase
MDTPYTTSEVEMADRIAIVTGASGGIGHPVAVRLAKAGMAVAVHYSGNRDRAQAVADEIPQLGAGP